MSEAGYIDRPEPLRLTIVDRLTNISWGLVFVVVALCLLGSLMLYSAALGDFGKWADAHLMRGSALLVLMVVVALVDIRFWLSMAWIIYIVGIALLVWVAFFGESGGGAVRWINLGFMELQPSELMKIGLVLVLARFFNGMDFEKIGDIFRLIIPVGLILLPAMMVLEQPDLGTATKLTAVGLAVMFLAGVRWWKFVAGAASILMIAPFFWLMLRDYQRQRILTFVNPEEDPLGAGYHIIQSKIAIGSGGVFGKGFLNGTQTQLEFLPEAQTDFIFALIAEEWGMMGTLLVLGLFVVLLAMGLAISMRAQNHFGRLLAAGLTMNLFLYLFINMGMVMGLLPVVGVPLPLISYGGSAMLAVMVSLGLIMNVHIHRDMKLTRYGDEKI